MKTIREYIDQLDEISRRDFLKGAGALAAAGAVGSSSAGTTLNLNNAEVYYLNGWLIDAIPYGTDKSFDMYQDHLASNLEKIDPKMAMRFEKNYQSGKKDWIQFINNPENKRWATDEIKTKRKRLEILIHRSHSESLEETSPEAIAKVAELTRK